MNPSTRTPQRRPPWKPPLWLLLLDTLGLLLLGLGLLLHYAPDTALAQMLPAEVRLPLLVGGGVMAGLGWVGMIVSVLNHQRG